MAKLAYFRQFDICHDDTVTSSYFAKILKKNKNDYQYNSDLYHLPLCPQLNVLPTAQPPLIIFKA